MTLAMKIWPKCRHRRSLVLTIVFLAGSACSASGQELNPFGGRTRYTQPTVLSPIVNDLIDGTDNPSISGDGLTIYYDGFPDNSKIAAIWQATRPSTDAEWENAQRLGDAVNSSVRQMEADVTADGLELYFRASDVVAPYESHSLDDFLMVATRTSTEDMWGEATRLPDSINSLPCVNSPTVTGDGLELYFNSIDTPGQKCASRNGDIYVSKRATRDDAWDEPQLVESLALTPGISPDGRTLYFLAGDRTGTDLPDETFANGPSVFVSTRNSRDEEFGLEVELGDPPNTSATFFAVWGPEPSSDGNTLYFSSNRAGAPSEYGVWQTTLAELCDINGDGSCNPDDLTRRSLFRIDLPEGSDSEKDIFSYDISGDGRVDQADLETWLSVAATTNGFTSSYVTGDTNLDGEVAFDDFLALADGFGGSNRDWAAGNFNGDKNVNFADFLALSENFGTQVSQTGAAAVPEPSSASLLIVSGVMLMLSKRKSRPLLMTAQDIRV